MRRRNIIQSLSMRELVEGLGLGPLLGAAASAIVMTAHYVGGDILRAIFWLLVMGLWVQWVSAHLESLLSDRRESDEKRVPFSAEQIEYRERAATDAWQEANALTDSLMDRFCGRQLNAVESAEFTRLNHDAADVHKTAKQEAELVDLMVQANAKVASGFELLSEARSRVLDNYDAAVHADLLEKLSTTESPHVVLHGTSSEQSTEVLAKRLQPSAAGATMSRCG